MRKGKLQIINCILEETKNGGSNKTTIMRRVNMNWAQWKDYSSLMMRARLMKKEDGNNGDGRKYVIDEKGREFQERYKEIKGLLSDKGYQ